MSIASESAILRHEFVLSLEKQGALQDPAITAAFASIPRELFVPQFYKRTGNRWQLCSQDTDRDAWLQMVYQDEALATLLDGERPISSSSQPSIMAAMLEALAVQPGYSVLEL